MCLIIANLIKIAKNRKLVERGLMSDGFASKVFKMGLFTGILQFLEKSVNIL